MNSNMIVVIIYISMFVGIAMGDVGNVPENTGEYPWYLPIVIFFALAIPSYFSYEAGKGSEF